MEYVLFIALGLIGSLASAVFGFGTALLVLAVGSHILPVKEAIALATVLFTASSVTKTLLFRKQIDWKIVAIMAIACVPFAYLGAELLAFVPAAYLKRLLGAMVLIYLGLSLVNRLPAIKVDTVGLLAGSALYGFISGFLGSGNLIKVMLFREMKITKEAFVGAMAATSVLSNFAKLSSYMQSGILHSDTLQVTLALAISAVAAAFVGRTILNKINLKTFEIGVQVLLGAAAAALLL